MSNWLNQTHIGDCRELLKRMAADGVRVQTCVTSPPYWQLRDYGVVGQIGLEPTLQEWIATMVDVFRCVRDVLEDDGTVWVNLGDSYNAYNGNRGQSESLDRKRDEAANVRPKLPKGAGLTHSGLKNKDLFGQPWRLAFALQDDGWYLRSDIVWHKPNPMPESVTDRPTKSHEYVFLFAKNERYYYDQAAIREQASPNTHMRTSRATSATPGQSEHEGLQRAPGVNPKAVNRYNNNGVGFGHGYDAPNTPRVKQNKSFAAAVSGVIDDRNKRSVWTIPTEAFGGAHFATFPCALIEPCILAGAPAGGIVLDPFMGSGTTAQVATDLGRNFIGCELNPEYVALHDMRRTTQGMKF